MKRAVLLLNMGGARDEKEIEIFLKNIFLDPNIISLPRPLRDIVAYIIRRSRVEEAKENLKKMGGRSPLYDITNSLSKKIEKITNIPTFFVMRYLPPFAKDILKDLKNKNIQELILLPMYPHYSFSTTKSSIEDIFFWLKRLNYNPSVKIVKPYYKNLEFIDIQKDLIKEKITPNMAKDFILIVSAHGLPQKLIEKGDPYKKHIETNYSLIIKKLKEENYHFKDTILAYQSKVGRAKWLEPNLTDVIKEIATKNEKKILIFPISFTIDNSETLYELEIENKEIASSLGIDSFLVASPPNDKDNFALFLSKLVKEQL
jgi:ferrochelatase